MHRMRVFGKLCAALLAGVAPAGLQAQETVSPSPPVQPKIEFRGADGKPLPPEVQRQLEEQLKNDPQLASKLAQQAAASKDEIVISGQRPRGSATSDIPPERTLRPDDIRAYGANDLEELLQTLGPQVRSERGREDSGPVVLLNGKRVSSLAEIAKIPTEAIERMDVLPEEAALAYGYPADQKVVNVVVLARFSSKIGRLSLAAPTEGGRSTPGAAAGYLLIKGDMRLNLDGEYSRSGALLESERNVAQASGSPDLGRFRTLLPETERLALGGTVSGKVIENVSTTLNGSFEASSSNSLYGLGPAGQLEGDSDTRLVHLGTTLGGTVRRWQWTFTGNYDRTGIDTVIDAGNSGGALNEAHSIDSFANADLLLSGQLLKLPAGPVSASVRGGADLRDFSSRSVLGGTERRFDLSRGRAALQASVDLPIARRRKDEKTWLGDLSLNANLELERLSDFGTLRTFGYGLNWSPVPSLDFSASATHEQGAPTVEQLGGPGIVTPNVRTFDFTRRETVEVTRTFGGNPALRSDDRRVIGLGLNAKPFAKKDFTISADYLSTRVDNPIAAFPITMPALEAAFPERFTRGADGRLLRIDARPLNFERSDQEHLRFGLNFSRFLGHVPPELRGAKVFYGQSEADIQKRYPGSVFIKTAPSPAMARGVENLRSRLFLNFYYTLRLKDEILLREGAPVLDLLNGSAIGPRGGRPGHELQLQAGAFKSGLGAQLTATWQNGTTLSGLPAGVGGAAGDLRFSDYGTVNINLFANLAEQFGGPKAPEWLKGTRVSLGIVNLLNARPEVRDGSGATPLNYQGAYLDPIGRSVSFSLRKVF
ncbi:MAG TPA: TonB-dependent receptor [Allosphingosinicella sp.]